ncbi:hypothetical protein [Streptomyces beihaiensis]|uniref:Uncharacterized protein n=1 Tax=Streptomyces beihaiensis TaxID=2984495 RepID=A0ABT3TV84_9ACTN|nr:hypothetical protein [Streptomyces beihaiensis]MCX3060950.1 hypothetical protein [Streptomyces beihaiensis]
MATTWGLLVEETDGMGDRKAYAAKVVEHVTGARDQVLARLEQVARNYVPQHPMNPAFGRRRRPRSARNSVRQTLRRARPARRLEKAAKRAQRAPRGRGWWGGGAR